MNVRRLSDDGDIIFGYGNSTFQRDNVESVATILKMRFNLIFGQWVMDTEAGFDLWLGEMSKESIDTCVRERILETENVIGIVSFESESDTKTRKYKARVSISTTYGLLDTEVNL